MIKKYGPETSTSNFNIFSIIKIISVSLMVISLAFIFFCFKKNNQHKTITNVNQEKNQTVEINKTNNKSKKKKKKKRKNKKTKTNSKIISKFASHFPNDETQANRIFNIKKIAKTLNNTVLQPNETFSFQKIYDISEKDGKFKPALGIANKKFSNNEYAGGICQVCTALFKVAELAKLEIVERHKHSIPVFYGPNRTDAMFNDKTADFRFKNTKTFPIKINSEVKDDFIEIKILKY